MSGAGNSPVRLGKQGAGQDKTERDLKDRPGETAAEQVLAVPA